MKRTLKKQLAILLSMATVVCFCFVGCSSNDTKNTNNTNNAGIVNSDGNINNNDVNNNNVGVSPASSKHPIMSLRRAVQRSKYNDLCLFCIWTKESYSFLS